MHSSWATSKTRTQTLDSDPVKPGPRKTWSLKNQDHKNLDHEKCGKQLDTEKKIVRSHNIIY